MSFAHLHLHTQYSLLDGANRLDELMDAASAAKMPAVAITDHGNLFGAIEFYNAARKRGVKPIIGIEAYVAKGSHTDRNPARSGRNHLVLLAQNEAGYRNLLKLTSRSFLEGFYYKPRIDHQLLRDHAEGLIGLSACLAGEVAEAVQAGDIDGAEETACNYREILGEGNFFLELQDHGIPEQAAVNEVLHDIARRRELPLVATNDCHYLTQADSFAHDVLLCVGTQRNYDDPDRLKYYSDNFYFKSADEMVERFPNDRQALENTLLIAERCNLEIPTGEFHLPDFPVPKGRNLDGYLVEMVQQGLRERFEDRAHDAAAISDDIYQERLNKELSIILEMGFAGYFLIVWDFIRHARNEGIPVGPGRGSAAGSLVAYALRITDIDPMQYNLLFERFLNPDRVSLPDIDIDFCMRRRGEVIQYVAEKYGRDHVAQIITFGTLAARAVIRDVGRVLGLPYAKVDRVAKMVPENTKSLAQAAREVDALAAEIRNDPEVHRVVEAGSRLEGLTRHASLHAAGVVITPRPIEELVPLYKTSKDEIVTQWDKDVIEDLGLLKMDFLGLRTLTVIDDAVKLLKQQGVEPDLEHLPLDDEATYQLFAEGRTDGVFQFESRGMKQLLRRAQPSRFEDLAALNALFRPGALSVGMADTFAERKQGRSKVKYLFPEMEPILEETYGVIVYQEQVMQVAVEIGGFSMAEADVLRKAMGKKHVEMMAQQKQKFVEGAQSKGFAKDKAVELWEYIEPFAGYGFNKSHSVAYALLAYKTGFLKTHHPVSFMAAMLTSEMASKDRVGQYIHECRQMDIEVLPPDINLSEWSFTVGDDSIRFGLGAIKGLGDGAIESVLNVRRQQSAFSDLPDFVSRVDPQAINSRSLDALIKSGAMDSFGASRRSMHEALERAVGYGQRKWRDREAGQSSLFGAESVESDSLWDNTQPEWEEQERLQNEKDSLGFYLTGNPLTEYSDVVAKLATHTTADIAEDNEGQIVIGGIVGQPKQVKIKSGRNAGRMMGRFILEDQFGRLSTTAFANAMQRYAHLMQEGARVLVKGVVRERGGNPELAMESLELLDNHVGGMQSVAIVVRDNLARDAMLQLRDVLTESPGSVPVLFLLRASGTEVEIQGAPKYGVTFGDDLVSRVERILGPGCVHPRQAKPNARPNANPNASPNNRPVSAEPPAPVLNS